MTRDSTAHGAEFPALNWSRRACTATGHVSVVVIVYNDAEHIRDAVRSALAQGQTVAEVIVVDDASVDGTREALLVFADDDRVRVLSRERNSGGCGTPRNDGMDSARCEYVMFLDSDDTFPPGAVDALLAAADAHDADVVAGQCLRRELPDGRTTGWQPQLFDPSAGAELPGKVMEGIGQQPGLLWDTLSVNKLYRRDFLAVHNVRFPSGAFHYEDFVFTARLYAAQPRLAILDTPVYVWHVRRQAPNLSISLHRSVISNWEHRVAAHRQAVDVLRTAGHPDLVAAAQGKFLDYDVAMYTRELPLRTKEYQENWWRVTNGYLRTFGAAGYAAARVPSQWLGRVLEALPEPAETGRLVELAAQPPRLAPPYSTDGATPVFGTGPASVPLEGLDELAPRDLPIAIDGRVTTGRVTQLTLRVHDLYGRLGALGPQTIRVIFQERSGARADRITEVPLVPDEEGWTAETWLPTSELTGPADLMAWGISAEVRCDGGEAVQAEVRASGAEQASRRTVVRLGRPLFVQAHVTPGSALMLRVVDSVRGLGLIAGGRARRLIRRLR
ncbi:glycosyltransferase family 2 protein [Streptomyces sp. NPDC056637]|uniref:glycosyltransferase family 2 protein n=1 Tax=Streptomyces sp. NPDC056637 TaxID=3345886 RepID=UPI0036BC87FF